MGEKGHPDARRAFSVAHWERSQQRIYMNYLFSRISVSCVAALMLVCASHLEAADKRPNIIVILADDMGFSDLGCYGGELKTPNLDKLAGEGLRFTQFYNTARCCPTRASLLTGLYPHQAGVGHMIRNTGHPGYTVGISTNTATMAEVLKGSGYGTYICLLYTSDAADE